MKKLYGFIGCGNMGSALIHAVAKKTNGRNVCVNDVNVEKAASVAEKENVLAVELPQLCEKADVIVLGVKPQGLDALMDTVAPIVKKRKKQPLVISMLAGTSIKTIENYLPNAPIVRIMPNLPAQIGNGMILYTFNARVNDEDKTEFIEDFAFAGKLLELKEDKFDAGCALSGSGPAYVCMMAEAMADGGVACGLTREESLALTVQTLYGTAALMVDGEHPAVLKDRVCSPAGTTIEGVKALEKDGFRGAVMDAVSAGYRRSLEMKSK